MAMKLALVALVALLSLNGCVGDETGTIHFTTRGAAHVEDGIPAGEGGFVDGWAVTFDNFLVNFHQLQVARSSGEIAETAPASYFVDNVVPGTKPLISFRDVTAKTWDRVSYQIKPAASNAVVVAGDPDDLAMMVSAGYSLYVSGSASRADVSKGFAFGFTTATHYDHCRDAGDGSSAGIVVLDGVEHERELTIQADHLFYDRIPGAPGAAPPALRFDALAAADDAGDGDGWITLDELAAAPLDAEQYETGELSLADLSELLGELSRLVGHFRGQGECRPVDVSR